MKFLLLFLISTTAIAGVSLRSDPFSDSYGYFFRGTGVAGTATKNVTSNIDYLVPYMVKITGVHMMLKNQCWGDTMKLQVVDVGGAYAPAGTVLDEYGSDWHVISDSESQGREQMPYAAKVLPNLTLRIVYTSTCNVDDVQVKLNYFLHKVP